MEVEVNIQTTGYAIETIQNEEESFVPTKRIVWRNTTNPEKVRIVGMIEFPRPRKICEWSIHTTQKI